MVKVILLSKSIWEYSPAVFVTPRKKLISEIWMMSFVGLIGGERSHPQQELLPFFSRGGGFCLLEYYGWLLLVQEKCHVALSRAEKKLAKKWDKIWSDLNKRSYLTLKTNILYTYKISKKSSQCKIIQNIQSQRI